MRLKPLLQFLLCLSLLSQIALPAFARVPAGVTVTVSPTSFTVPINGDRQFTAHVSGATNTAVTWSVNNIVGGNSTVGTISTAGLYRAPAVPPPNWTVTVKATSVADPAASASSTVTVRYQIPYVTSVSPNQVPFGACTLTVTGSRFVNGAQVRWNGTPLPTVFLSSTQLQATGNATQAGLVNITVANPGPGAVSSVITLSVISGVSVSISPNTASVAIGATQQFQATVSGTTNQAVTWKVNGTVGGDPSYGTISSTGLYNAPGAIPVGAVTVSAVSVADSTVQAMAAVSVLNPALITYGRFLEQCTFGPTAQLMAHAQQVGMQAFLDEQFATPESPWPNMATAQRQDAVDAFFFNAGNGQDQLRQRVIFALGEIIVIAMNKNTNGNELVPWLQILSRNAFGNYRTLLREITLDASMGKYLDMVNSVKPTANGGANENYAREVMQLFTVGLYKLNLDGSLQLDAQNQPILTYTQTDVRQVALAFTGWTYGNASGIPPTYPQGSYYPGPMQPLPNYHDLSAKTILGQSLPANQSPVADLDGALNIIFNHPNVGPFIATRLIRALVTSNPSPAYIARVATVFNNSGQGVRGDMKAVIRAIIMDPEARDDNPPANFGRLRTPVQATLAMLRALNFPIGGASQIGYIFYTFGEGMLDAPSVFGHYSPMFRIPKTTLFGPEFQIYSPTEAVNRANFLYSYFGNPWPISPVLQPFVNLAGTPSALVNAVDNTLLYGRMSPVMRSALLTAMPAMYDNNQRVMTALYLTVTSGDYLVQH